MKRSQIYAILSGNITSVPPWDFVLAFVSACSRYARTHGRLLSLSADPAVWRRQHDYVVRSNEATEQSSKEIRRFGSVPSAADCFQDRRMDLPRSGSTTVLCGLGGVGKTQLAADLVRKLSKRGAVDLVIWVNASSRATILSAYTLAGRELAGFRHDDHELGAGHFLGWLASNRRWTVVLDDLRSPTDARGLWPPAAPLSYTVVTTRRHDAALSGAGRNLVDIGLFTPAQSRRYLAEKLAPTQELLERADELAVSLGHLPLALAQAAAYMNDRRLNCRAYLERFQKELSLSKVFPEADALPDDHRTVLAATWSLSIEAADRLSPVGLARPAIHLASLLDPHSTPVGVFRTPAALTYIAGASQAAHSRAEDALYCLQRLSLLTIDAEQDAVRVHALVQRAVRETLGPAQMCRLAQAAADALLELWPGAERDPRSQTVRASALALVQHSSGALLAARAHPILFQIGRSLAGSGLVRPAVDYFRSLAADCADGLGPEHVDTLAARGEAAYWRGEAGDPLGAITETDQVLSDRIRILGPDHPDTLTARHHAAGWRGRAGDPSAAATGLRSVLTDRIRVLGTDHEDTLNNRNSLAAWLGYAGDPAATAAALEAVLLDRLRVLGPDHPDTLDTRHHLAKWQGEAGRALEAYRAFTTLLADRIRVLGPDHPDTLATRYRAAHWHGVTGDAQAAAQSLRRLLGDCLRVFGPDHPGTLQVRSGLATWLGHAGQEDTAEVMLRELLADQLRILGADHPDTRDTRARLSRSCSP